MSKRRHWIIAGISFSFFLLLAPFLVQGAPLKKEPSPKKELHVAASPSEKGNPVEGKRIFRHYCAACHGLSGKGNGVNADNLDPHPSDLTSDEIQSLEDKEIFEVIEKGGGAVELSAAMPPWGKTLSGNQIRDLVAYVRTFGEPKEGGEKEVRVSDLQREGRFDCQVCHVKEKQSPTIAPNLGHEGSKLNEEWLAEFLKDPGRIRPVGYMPLTKAKMPNFQMSPDEIASLVAYLMTQKDDGVSSASLGGFNLSDPAEIQKGKKLFSDKYACDSCHKTGKEAGGGIVGPELSQSAKRLKPEWVFSWIKNPQAIRPDVPMPNFGIPDSEIRSLIAYIYSLGGGAPQSAMPSQPVSAGADLLAKGEKLIKDKNCLSCHTLDRFNSQGKNQEKRILLPRS
ncbi:MAG: c-type cytochrome [Candidatus Manganitrophaceae bacterium]